MSTTIFNTQELRRSVAMDSITIPRTSDLIAGKTSRRASAVINKAAAKETTPKEVNKNDFKFGAELIEEVREAFPENSYVSELLEANKLYDLISYMEENKNLTLMIHVDALEDILSEGGIAALKNLNKFIEKKRADISLYRKLQYLKEINNKHELQWTTFSSSDTISYLQNKLQEEINNTEFEVNLPPYNDDIRWNDSRE